MLVAATFTELVERRFGETRLHSDVVRYVAEVRARPSASELGPRAAEGVLRAALGDTTAIADLDAESQAWSQFILVSELFDDENLDTRRIDVLMARAKARAEQTRILL